MLFAASLALLAQSFQGKERGLAFGIWGAVTEVAAGLGPVVGGFITSGISWRGIFLVNLPIGVAAHRLVTSVAGGRIQDACASQPARWAGFITLTAGLISLVYGLIRAGERAWSSIEVDLCLVLAVVFFVAFVALERRAEHPLFDLSLFQNPHLQRWIDCGLCDERFALPRHALVPRPLSAGRPRLLPRWRPVSGYCC